MSPQKPIAVPNPSTWPLAIRPQSSSGLSVHHRWARARRAGSPRSSRSSSRATAPNAIALNSLSQKMMLAADRPPSSAAAACSMLATGP